MKVLAPRIVWGLVCNCRRINFQHLGNEAIRYSGRTVGGSTAVAEDIFTSVECRTGAARVEIRAPNNALVAHVEFDSDVALFDVKKHTVVKMDCGRIRVSLADRSNLIAGEKFARPPVRVQCKPTVNGGMPANWEHAISTKYDGTTLWVEVNQVSVGLRNKNLSEPMKNVADGEELLICSPVEGFKVGLTRDKPMVESNLQWSFCLRDIDGIAK